MNILKKYIINYPNSFVGFLIDVSDILKSLGDEWTEHGKKEWGEVFLKSSNTILTVATDLDKLRTNYENENIQNN